MPFTYRLLTQPEGRKVVYEISCFVIEFKIAEIPQCGTAAYFQHEEVSDENDSKWKQ